ncbi:glycosyltransferase family 2 protein [uncultured Selenomonas sp.]|uniref:glycosyltransferase family 2 protein n=1 Tax=uncultured Selenomonas sp. TaxID=159275 RepID=UPI0025F54DBA|nr:glycosyltransferase family 2 protein [uncultured Selenomonas sp.]
MSVIVPIYNVASYLAACLDSILAQTFRDFEVILVDDGSTDESADIAAAYAKKDARILLIRHRWNRGAADARNLGLELCRGRYVSFIDGDDVLMPSYLERLLLVAQQTNADVVLGMYQMFQKTLGDEQNIQGFKTPAQLKDDLQIRLDFFFHGPVHLAPWCKIYRRSFLDQHHMKFYRVPVAEDVSFHYQCILTAPVYVIIPDVLYGYRQRPGSLVTVKGVERVRRYAVAMARAVDGVTRWAQEESLFPDGRTKHQISAVIYTFFRWKLRELAKSLGEEEVFEVCAKAFAEEPQKALQEARAYAELVNM